MKKISYKNECLKINLNLKLIKQGKYYNIVVGNKDCHTNYSKSCEKSADAWKDCYESLKKPFQCAKGCTEMCMSCEVEKIRNKHR